MAQVKVRIIKVCGGELFIKRHPQARPFAKCKVEYWLNRHRLTAAQAAAIMECPRIRDRNVTPLRPIWQAPVAEPLPIAA